jgi:hypothetical protein
VKQMGLGEEVGATTKPINRFHSTKPRRWMPDVNVVDEEEKVGKDLH